MKSVSLTNLMVLLTTVAVASLGCAHSQRPERKVYVIFADASAVGSNDARGIGGAGADAYCNELQKQCFTKCWRRKPEHSTIPKHSEKHNDYCMACVKEQEELERQESMKKPLQFKNMDAALDWLREHTTEAPPGTNVVVTGVVFVVAVVAGALVLAPL